MYLGCARERTEGSLPISNVPAEAHPCVDGNVLLASHGLDSTGLVKCTCTAEMCVLLLQDVVCLIGGLSSVFLRSL